MEDYFIVFYGVQVHMYVYTGFAAVFIWVILLFMFHTFNDI